MEQLPSRRLADERDWVARFYALMMSMKLRWNSVASWLFAELSK